MIKFYKNTPYSTKFNDFYFNSDEPILERFHTYASALHLINKPQITIAEAGFGAGLNFFTTALSLGDKSMHYIACEKYPLQKSQLKIIYQNFPQLNELFTKFISQYEVLNSAIIRIKIGTKITLDIFFGDILDFLNECEFRADLWYLDGFSPSKNPDFYSDEFFSRLGEFCFVNTIVRSFSSAAVVKNGLTNNGFSITKLSGHGKKREFTHATALVQKPFKTPQAWFSLPKIAPFSKVLIIGAGIAGLSVAKKFQDLSCEVVIVDKMNSVATNGSSNLAGILMPLITKPGVTLGAMHLSAFLLARHFYANSPFCDVCGVKDYAFNQSLNQRFLSWEDNEIFSYSKDDSPYPSAFISSGAQICVKQFCEALSSSYDLRLNHKFTSIEKLSNSYLVGFENGSTIEADLVIFAMGSDSGAIFRDIFIDENILLSSVRGQVTHLKSALSLTSPISARGYICKPKNGLQVIGATYARNDLLATPRSIDDKENLSNISEFLNPQNQQLLGSNVAFRGYSADRFPLIGAIYDSQAFKQIYKSLLWTKNRTDHQQASHLQNILITAAHGSRGLCTGVFGAEILLDMALNRQICTTKTILNALNPARFLIRKLKKGLI